MKSNNKLVDIATTRPLKKALWQEVDVTKAARARRLKQKPAIIWFTGLSGSGKSTLANALQRYLFVKGYATYLLDGDKLRQGLCSDLGFSDADRVENIRRASETAKLFCDAGMIVLASFISPFALERQRVRGLVDAGEFIEVYVNTPLSICEKRDVKGLYRRARAGEIGHFTGIDSPYEVPEQPELVINTAESDVDAAIQALIECLRRYGVI